MKSGWWDDGGDNLALGRGSSRDSFLVISAERGEVAIHFPLSAFLPAGAMRLSGRHGMIAVLAPGRLARRFFALGVTASKLPGCGIGPKSTAAFRSSDAQPNAAATPER
jgi:hypothetical protein